MRGTEGSFNSCDIHYVLSTLAFDIPHLSLNREVSSEAHSTDVINLFRTSIVLIRPPVQVTTDICFVNSISLTGIQQVAISLCAYITSSTQ